MQSWFPVTCLDSKLIAVITIISVLCIIALFYPVDSIAKDHFISEDVCEQLKLATKLLFDPEEKGMLGIGVKIRWMKI